MKKPVATSDVKAIAAYYMIEKAKELLHEPAQPCSRAATGSAEAWRKLASQLADEATVVLDNAHWEVKHGSGDLLTTIKAVREKYRLETQMPPNDRTELRLPGSAATTTQKI